MRNLATCGTVTITATCFVCSTSAIAQLPTRPQVVEVELASEDATRLAFFGYEEATRTWYLYDSRCGTYNVGPGGVVYFSTEGSCNALAAPNTLLHSYLPQLYLRGLQTILPSSLQTKVATAQGIEFNFDSTGPLTELGGVPAYDFVCSEAGVVQGFRPSKLKDAVSYSPQNIAITEQGLQIASPDQAMSHVLSASVKDASGPFTKDYVVSRIRLAIKETGERGYALAKVLPPSTTAPVVESPAVGFDGRKGSPMTLAARSRWVLLFVGIFMLAIGTWMIIKRRS